jgi:hypothetical protein
MRLNGKRERERENKRKKEALSLLLRGLIA